MKAPARRKKSLRIRRAQVRDCALILSLIRELADYEKLGHEVQANTRSLRASLFGTKPAAECLIAESEGEALGFALYFHNYSTFLGRRGLYLEDLFVRPAARGRGIGKALLVRLAQIAVQRGCGRYEWAVLDWNRPALEFYLSLGAQPKPEWVLHRVTGVALQKLAQRR